MKETILEANPGTVRVFLSGLWNLAKQFSQSLSPSERKQNMSIASKPLFQLLAAEMSWY